MDMFYTIVLTIAVVLLILILTYIGISMANKNNAQSVYPPVVQNCPDYWDLSGNRCVIPASNLKNTGDIYSSTVPNQNILSSNSTPGYNPKSSSLQSSIDFKNAGWTNSGALAVCAQKNWAIDHEIVWDGVTNYNGC